MRRNRVMIKGYFSVEAALIMPMVFLCYFSIIICMFYFYERCIWEQNACRLPLWIKFTEREVGWYSNEKGTFLGEDICEYAEQCLREEEKTRYLFATNADVNIKRRGRKLLVERRIVFSAMLKSKQELQIQTYCPDKVSFLRTVRRIGQGMFGEEEKTEEQGESADDKK